MIVAMPQAAADRLSSGPSGSRCLLGAITARGDALSIVPFEGGAPDLSDIPEGAQVMVYGGHPFLHATRQARPDLSTGIFHDPETVGHDRVTAALGEMSLNAGGRIGTVPEAIERVRSGESVFLRPVAGDKSFPGAVFGPGQMKSLLDLDRDAGVVIAEVVPIIAEYRFIVADGAVVTGSQYRRDNVMDIRIDTHPGAEETAMIAAGEYHPMRVFTCDVAETPRGFKVVEYNSFSASGLYACDGRAILEAAARIIPAPVPSCMPI